MTEQLIHLDQIHDNPKQHRGQYSDIEGLARGIAEIGLQQSPKARKNGKVFELKFGHRRKRAFEWLSKNWKKEGLTDRYNGYTVMPLEIEDLTDKEMFDAMIMENMHRADLKPTEVAFLLNQYQGEYPEATSKEIGLKFNMNESTVRGMVRFLELPRNWQESLDAGRITQGTARTGLSLQKLFAPEQMIKLLDEIEKGVDEDGDPVEATSIIENALRWGNQGRIEDMWSESRRDGKPRSNWQNGWLLDMKNFPNKLLEPLTYKDVNEALQIEETPRLKKLQDSLIADGKISFYDMLEAMKVSDNADNRADAVRVEHLLNPTSCAACPFYAKVGGTHYCGMKVCWTRKMQAWKLNIIQAASRDLGIAIYSPITDDKYQPLSYGDKGLFDKRNADLRLIEKNKVKGYYGQGDYKGVNDDVFLVVLTGKTLANRKSKKSSNGSGLRQAELEAVRYEKLMEDSIDELRWEATNYLKELFSALPFSALDTLEDSAYGWTKWSICSANQPADDAKETVKAEHLRRVLSFQMIHCAENDITEFLEDLVSFADWVVVTAKSWGIKVPSAYKKHAAEMKVQMEQALSSPVSTATAKGKKG